MEAVLVASPELPSETAYKETIKVKVAMGSTTFCEKDVNDISGGQITVVLPWNDSVEWADNVANGNHQTEWGISQDGGSNYFTITSLNHPLFLTYGGPLDGQRPTAKRVFECVKIADGKATEQEIVNVIGPDAVGSNRFDGDNSIFDNMTTAWEIMDGKDADCGSLSTLMKYELDLLGVPGAFVYFVYARHKSWVGLSSTSPGAREENSSNVPLDFWVAGGDMGGLNKYEGCCKFVGDGSEQWWAGGTGTAFNSAYEIWQDMTGDNLDGLQNHHQCWEDNEAIAVSPPAGIPPN
jgi:hypothetical protein